MVSLNCPNCGNNLGYAGHEDGYKEHFYPEQYNIKHGCCLKCQSYIIEKNLIKRFLKYIGLSKN